MVRATQENTQVYSPLGSFVVEQHDSTGRYEAVRRRYESSTYRTEKVIGLAWLLMFVVLVGGSVYGRLGRPDLSAMTQADAAVITGTIGISNRSGD